MSRIISRDDLPETPEWSPEPRACPCAVCDVCAATVREPNGYGTYPPNVTPGEN